MKIILMLLLKTVWTPKSTILHRDEQSSSISRYTKAILV